MKTSLKKREGVAKKLRCLKKFCCGLEKIDKTKVISIDRAETKIGDHHQNENESSSSSSEDEMRVRTVTYERAYLPGDQLKI